MDLTRPEWFPDVFSRLLAGQELDPDSVTRAFRELIAGKVADGPAAALLTSLRMKGETGTEIAAAATALREQMTRLEGGNAPVVDTCGTGGDGSGTFNISTAAALVTAGAGVRVVKHGNRAVSSKSGSADVLRELGVPIEAGPAWAQDCLNRIGFAFCYAPQFHPGMAHVAPLRRQLGVRTIFNLLGPLANPASAEYQVLGVGSPELLDPLAAAVARLGVRRAFVVCSRDGLDEVSLSAPTMVRVIEGNQVRTEEWEPARFGLPSVALSAVRAESAVDSAAMISAVIRNDDVPARGLVLVNAAAAILVAGAADSMSAGIATAARSIESGAAMAVLDQLRQSFP